MDIFEKGRYNYLNRVLSRFEKYGFFYLTGSNFSQENKLYHIFMEPTNQKNDNETYAIPKFSGHKDNT